MEINQILQKVENLSQDSRYLFVRTEKGLLFDQFTKENHIAIGWDYLTLYQLRKLSINEIKEKIALKENLDITKSKGKGMATMSYNKLMLFLNLKKDDIIIIPSRNSDRLAFGRIVDIEAYEEVEAERFLKRRKIEWFKIFQMNDLNPIFYQVKSNHHTISHIDRFAPHIDRVIGNLFQKGDTTHYVLNIEKEEDINFNELNNLMDNIKTLLNKINNEFDFNENPDEFYIKINLQSKGAFELIKKGKSLAVLAFLLSTVSCVDNQNQLVADSDIDKFIIENRKLLDDTTKDIDTLKINTEDLIKPFTNGN
jgi:restriction system protein